MRLNVIEVTNAMSMIIPLREFHKQTKTKYDMYMCEMCFIANMCTSVAYHTSCALIKEHSLFITILRVLDISAIHALTHACGSHAVTKPSLNALWNAAIVPLNLQTIYSTIKNPYNEAPGRRIIVSMLSMSPLLFRNKVQSMKLLTYGMLCAYTYQKGLTTPVLHTLFHFLLGPVVKHSYLILGKCNNNRYLLKWR